MLTKKKGDTVVINDKNAKGKLTTVKLSKQPPQKSLVAYKAKTITKILTVLKLLLNKPA